MCCTGYRLFHHQRFPHPPLCVCSDHNTSIMWTVAFILDFLFLIIWLSNSYRGQAIQGLVCNDNNFRLDSFICITWQDWMRFMSIHILSLFLHVIWLHKLYSCFLCEHIVRMPEQPPRQCVGLHSFYSRNILQWMVLSEQAVVINIL